jgi:hypothetical protein
VELAQINSDDDVSSDDWHFLFTAILRRDGQQYSGWRNP